MSSIYHFFAHLMRNSSQLKTVDKLDGFQFDIELLSCRNNGVFPDLAIRLNTDDSSLTGGELIELKDSQSYSISSFNSTIPTATKAITDVAKPNSTTRRQMVLAGDDVDSLPIRDVYYLIRGKKNQYVKVCLVHGSFFETVKAEQLIQQAFSQVLEERITLSGMAITDEIKNALIAIFSHQASFSRVRDVERASVKLRFRIMTEAKADGNILNASKYSDIKDNTLNLVLPCHTEADKAKLQQSLQSALSLSELATLQMFTIRHLLNGDFLVFQLSLTPNA